MDDVPTGQPALALAQKVISRAEQAGMPADLIPSAITGDHACRPMSMPKMRCAQRFWSSWTTCARPSRPSPRARGQLGRVHAAREVAEEQSGARPGRADVPDELDARAELRAREVRRLGCSRTASNPSRRRRSPTARPGGTANTADAGVGDVLVERVPA